MREREDSTRVIWRDDEKLRKQTEGRDAFWLLGKA